MEVGNERTAYTHPPTCPYRRTSSGYRARPVLHGRRGRATPLPRRRCDDVWCDTIRSWCGAARSVVVLGRLRNVREEFLPAPFPSLTKTEKKKKRLCTRARSVALSAGTLRNGFSVLLRLVSLLLFIVTLLSRSARAPLTREAVDGGANERARALRDLDAQTDP